MIRKTTNQTFASMIVASAFFMSNLDTSVVATALPQIAASFTVSPIQLDIIITAYLLALAIFVPISGWLADRFGSVNVFRAAIAIFVIGSTWSAASSSVAELTAARVLQGSGGAMIIPVGRVLVIRGIPKSEMMRAMAFLLVPAQIGPIVGPLLGGFITTYFSWRWAFLINVPIGVLGLAAMALLPTDAPEPERKPFDWLGFAWTSLCVASLIFGLGAVGHDGGATRAGVLMAAGLVFAVLSIRHFRRHPHPLLDLSLMRIPTFHANMSGGSLFRLGYGAQTLLLPLLFQVVFGLSAFASGSITFATAAGAVLVSALSQRILRRFPFRTLIIGNGIVVAVTFLWCGFFFPGMPLYLITFLLFITGFFQSLQFISLGALAYADIQPPQMNAAASFAQLSQQLGRTFGVAVAALSLNLALLWRGQTELAQVDFMFSFAVLFASALAGTYLISGLGPDAGSELRGRGSSGTGPRG